MTLKTNRAEKLELWSYRFLVLFAFSDLFSISIAQMAGAIFFLLWVGIHVTERSRPDIPPLFIPLLLFASVSIIAAFASVDIARSIHDLKDLFHMGIYFAAIDLFRRDLGRSKTVLRAVVLSGLAISLVGFFQAASSGIDLDHRISGFSGHYMTYAGLLSLASVIAVSVILFDFSKWRDSWVGVAFILMITAIFVSLTRNAAIGVACGVAVAVIMKKPVAILLLPVIAGLLFLLAPPQVKDRVMSITDLNNPTNRERILLWKAGYKITVDHPFFGTGPDTFPVVYKDYRDPKALYPTAPHLHNNFLQISAGRGFIGLVAWIGIWVMAYIYLIKAWIARDRTDRSAAASIVVSISGITALLTAGMFEYNFGDSEVQMLMYLILAVGLSAVARPQRHLAGGARG